MKYRFAREHKSYEDYASGRVFYGRPGHPALPVRLASEVFQRCLAIRYARGLSRRCVLYDPCCGGAYHLSTLWYLHGRDIRTIVGSDLDLDALTLAERNLSLLTLEGLDRRMAEIEEMVAAFGKPSHVEARESTLRLRQRLALLLQTFDIETRLFQADATDSSALAQELAGTSVDVVLTDVPYGWRSEWQGGDNEAVPAGGLLMPVLDALRTALTAQAVVAIVADKGQTIAHKEYRRLERFRLGKRQVALLEPI
jgi:hypothetical protein